jgi:nucleotide-binding universal stress UspA family protein
MQSVWRDIAVVLDASPAGESVGRHAVELAKRHQAHLVGIYGMSHEHYLPEDFVQGASAIRHVSERRRESEERKILVAGRRFAKLSQDRGISSEFRVVWRDGFQNDAVLRALHCDLIVSTHPRPDDLPASWSAERLLLSTGTPVLLVPSSWSGQSIGETVMIAWNRSRESRRAVNDAMPFISTAGRVTILVVDGDGNANYFGESPGANLFDHLSRHGAKVDIARVSSDGAPIAEAISKQAIEHNADLLVLGAYSRPRMTEILFGGTTRSLLANAPLPLLISR